MRNADNDDFAGFSGAQQGEGHHGCLLLLAHKNIVMILIFFFN